YLKTFFQGRPDLKVTLHSVVLTHPHIDHTRGVKEVLAKYTVLNAVTNGQETGSGKDGQIALHQKAKQSNLGFAAIQREQIPPGKGLTKSVIDPEEVRRRRSQNNSALGNVCIKSRLAGQGLQQLKQSLGSHP